MSGIERQLHESLKEVELIRSGKLPKKPAREMIKRVRKELDGEMSREIKFRAYDGMDWVYSSAVEYRKEDDQWLIYDFELEEWLYCSKPEQYTGLKDKNGVEIYEGDVVKSANDNVEVVQFHHGGYEPIMRYAEDVFEVIGNIYENPELLEVK